MQYPCILQVLAGASCPVLKKSVTWRPVQSCLAIGKRLSIGGVCAGSPLALRAARDVHRPARQRARGRGYATSLPPPHLSLASLTRRSMLAALPQAPPRSRPPAAPMAAGSTRRRSRRATRRPPVSCPSMASLRGRSTIRTPSCPRSGASRSTTGRARCVSSKSLQRACGRRARRRHGSRSTTSGGRSTASPSTTARASRSASKSAQTGVRSRGGGYQRMSPRVLTARV